MDFRELVTFSATSKENLQHCKKTMRSRVKELLQEFGLEYDKTMIAMKEHSAIISGSTALAVLLADQFEPGDIDFYVRSHNADGFHSWITSETKYRDVEKSLTAKDSSYTRQNSGIHEVKWLAHSVSGKKMNLVSVQTPSAMGILPRFYTTLSMNVICWTGVGCAYPALTTRRVGVLAVKDSANFKPITERIEKAQKRGFVIASDWEEDVVVRALGVHKCGIGRTCPRGVRRTRSNRGFLWMALDRWEEGEMQENMPDIAWLMMPGRICGEKLNTP
ncbi:hypothetical protein DFP72DRAFT_831844 [Ephemerocybe angulata]|uniref:Uncharacterized protein n=1 Tax=Ephemerocybe angulata TaxID=980116 RepID=A0A8H6LSD3_9AGAR|nr:hypothetical protein DFP72DRAFT_831844 [Tulosesus angulatus]